MRLSNFTKYKELLGAVGQTAVLIIFCLIITILKCEINNEAFDWLTFLMTFGLSLYSKIIYTNYKSKECLNNNLILQKQCAITEDKNYIYKNDLTEEFKRELERRNNIEKLNALINKWYGNIKKEKQLKWAIKYRKALKEKSNTEELKEYNLNSFKINYNHISFNTLFNYGKSTDKNEKKYHFNKSLSVANLSILPMILSFIVSYLFATLTVNNYVSSGQVWVDLASYLISIAMGVYTGFSIGEKVIMEDYCDVLENVCTMIREIKNDIKKDNQ